MRWLILLLITFLPAQSWANGKKSDIAIGFHLETDQNSGRRLTFEFEIAGKKRLFDRSAVITHNDFMAFDTFPAADGTFGVSFILKKRPAERFNNLMMQAQGRYLLAQVNGRFPDAVYIDKPVADRTLVIWRGITAAEIKQYDELLPRVEELEKAREPEKSEKPE